MPTQANLMGSGCPALQSIASVGIAKTGLTGLGTTQGTATVLPSDFNVFNNTALSTGAILPATGVNIQLADTIIVINHGANPLTVYPPVGGTLSTLATNTGVAMPAGKTAWFLVSGTNAYAYSLSN